MKNCFCRYQRYQVSQDLASCAQGRTPAELVVKNARLVNVCTHEILEHTDVACIKGRIAYVGISADHCIGEDTQVIDAEGRYLAPGFLDGHIHVESSMVSVGQYARATIPHGTVGIFWDPHEICNVLGLKSVEMMIEEAATSPLKAYVTTPSCVPAVPGFEDTGAELKAADIQSTMDWPSVVGLGEMMNFPGVLFGDQNVHDELRVTEEAGGIITGHYSIPEPDQGLNAYISTGIRCCHESTRAEDALAKMRLGMYAQIREGSAWHDLHELSQLFKDAPAGFDSRFACLISDDTHPNTLVSHGHLDHIVRRAIEEGIDPITAIQMVTINTAQCFQLDHELGSITPGKCADMVLLDSLEDCAVSQVFIDGVQVASQGKPLFETPQFDYPGWATQSMQVGIQITEDTFKIPAPDPSASHVQTRVIEVIPARVSNYERICSLPVVNGLVEGDHSQDILKSFVFERHHNTKKYACGFTKGFGIICGAMASTVAHDAHNLLVLGTNDADMALAANTLIECGGGSVVVQNGEVLACVPLPIAGLMSPKPVEEVAHLVEQEEAAWEKIGCSLPSPFMTMALIPLACLPELRLTNRGLVDCNNFKFVPLFVEETN